MNLLIVEDSELIRTQILRLLAMRPEISVMGVAGDEDAAVSLILASRPDAVLLDLALGNGSGFRVLKRIRLAGSKSHVFVMNNQSGEALRKACESLGIAGFYDMNVDTAKCLEHLSSWLPPTAGITAAGDCATFRTLTP